jgi:hypothetical protein
MTTTSEEEECPEGGESCQRMLEIGKTIHSAKLDLTRTVGAVEQHEYKWHTVVLDVFRVVMSLEDRVIRAGMMGMISNYVVLG